MSDLTWQRLKELLHYDPDSGVFTWRVTRKKCPAGKRSGTQRSDGYRIISIDRKNYLESRLAFFYMLEKWPTHHIDHRDRDPSNTKWLNLREATQSQNAMNSPVRTNNRTGFKGVRRAKQPVGYEAYYFKNGKHVTIGTFPTIEAASTARRAAVDAAYGEFAHHE